MAESNHCIRCGSDFKKGQLYCVDCGSPVVNRCCDPGDLLREPCGNVCGRNESFCPKCGSQTIFHKVGFLTSPYVENKVLTTDELSDMQVFFHKFFMD